MHIWKITQEVRNNTASPTSAAWILRGWEDLVGINLPQVKLEYEKPPVIFELIKVESQTHLLYNLFQGTLDSPEPKSKTGYDWMLTNPQQLRDPVTYQTWNFTKWGSQWPKPDWESKNSLSKHGEFEDLFESSTIWGSLKPHPYKWWFPGWFTIGFTTSIPLRILQTKLTATSIAAPGGLCVAHVPQVQPV